MTIADRAVAEARLWMGTPYVHQMSVRGAGCDCLGLLRGVWRGLYGEEPELVPPYGPDWDEVAGRDLLWAAASRHLVARDRSAGAGDVLLFRMRDGAVAKHLGIASGAGRFIHAYARHGVVENTLSAPWARRVVGAFGFPAR